MSENREFPVVCRYFSVISRRSWDHGRQEGCDRAGSSTGSVARKSEDLKAMNGFCITRVMDVLSVFTFSYLKCLHSWRIISNFRKIFVAEGNSYIFFVPFSYEPFTFHVYSPSLRCLLVRFDCVDTNRANKKLPYMTAKFSSPFYFQFHLPQMRFSLLFIFKLDCAKYHRRLAKRSFQDISYQPNAQKHAVITI